MSFERLTSNGLSSYETNMLPSNVVKLEMQYKGTTWFLYVREEILAIVVEQYDKTYPGIIICEIREGVRSRMELIRRKSNPDGMFVALFSNDTHWLGINPNDFEKQGGATLYAYSKKEYEVVGTFALPTTVTP